MKKLVWIIPLIIILLGVGAGYYYGYQYSESRFLPNTTINGVAVGGKTAEEASSLIASHDKTLSVVEKVNGSDQTMTETIDLEQAGYEETFDTAASLSAQDHKLWFKCYFTASELTLEPSQRTVQTAQLREQIDTLYCMQAANTTEPTDAAIAYENGTFTVSPSDDGCAVDQDKVVSLITKAAQSGQMSVDLTQDCYLSASVKTDDAALRQKADELNKVFTKKITITFYGSVQTVVSEEELRSMVQVGDDFTFTVGEDALAAYVETLDETYSTQRHKRTFATSSGTTAQVGTPSDTFGYDLSAAMMRESLKKVLLGTDDATIEAVWDSEGIWDDARQNDIGTSYIEISLSQQHLWYYINGQLQMECDIVSGQKGTADTPAGVYKVTEKQSNVTVATESGSPKAQEYIVVTKDGFGIYDASWRTLFGGVVYETSGTGGGISLPESSAGTLYQAVTVGTPVVIY